MVIRKPSVITRRSYKARLLIVVGMVLGPVLLLAAGCGQGTKMPEVSGTVTVDGSLIDEGTIRFASIDRKGPTAGTMIRKILCCRAGRQETGADRSLSAWRFPAAQYLSWHGRRAIDGPVSASPLQYRDQAGSRDHRR